VESFGGPSGRAPDPVCPRCHSHLFAGWMGDSAPLAVGGCDGSPDAGVERPILAGVCQILGPLRGPYVQSGPRQAPTRASTPQGSAARFLVQEKEEQSGGRSPQQMDCPSLFRNGCKSVFLSHSWTGLQSLKVPCHSLSDS